MSSLTQFPALLAVDIIENDSSYKIVANVKGFRENNVSVTKWHDSIVIELTTDSDSNQENFYLGELDVETYRRVIPLGFEIEQSDIQTSLDGGKLTVNVAKQATMQEWDQSEQRVAVA